MLNLVFPPQCLNCQALLPRHGALCTECWQRMRFIAEPYCACCGYPFDVAMEAQALCADCILARPGFSRARSVFRYDDASRRLVLQLKYHDQTYLASVYGPWMASAGRELIAASDMILPVPLHYWRFVRRRYNQSAMLAQSLARHTGLPYTPDLLMRIRATAPQSGLTRRQREENVKNAFALTPKYSGVVRGKILLLVDDVLTTATTIEACTKVLMQSGAAGVNVLTLARRV